MPMIRFFVIDRSAKVNHWKQKKVLCYTHEDPYSISQYKHVVTKKPLKFSKFLNLSLRRGSTVNWVHDPALQLWKEGRLYRFGERYESFTFYYHFPEFSCFFSPASKVNGVLVHIKIMVFWKDFCSVNKLQGFFAHSLSGM